MKCLVPGCSAVLTDQESFCPNHLEAYLDFMKLSDASARATQRATIQSSAGRQSLATKMGIADAPTEIPSSAAVATGSRPEEPVIRTPEPAVSSQSIICGQCNSDRGEQRYICSHCTSKVIERARVVYGISPSDTRQTDALWDKLSSEATAQALLAKLDEDETPTNHSKVQPEPETKNEAPSVVVGGPVASKAISTPMAILLGLCVVAGIGFPIAMTLMTGGSASGLFRVAIDAVQGKGSNPGGVSNSSSSANAIETGFEISTGGRNALGFTKNGNFFYIGMMVEEFHKLYGDPGSNANWYREDGLQLHVDGLFIKAYQFNVFEQDGFLPAELKIDKGFHPSQSVVDLRQLYGQRGEFVGNRQILFKAENGYIRYSFNSIGVIDNVWLETENF